MLRKEVVVGFMVVVLLLIVGALFMFLQFKASRQLSLEEKQRVNSEKVLGSFLKEFLQKELLPPKLNVLYKLSSAGTLNGTNYTYGTIWDVADSHLHADVHYDFGLRNVEDYSVKILTNSTPVGRDITSLDFARTYFKRFPGPWKCRTYGEYNLTVCESFSLQKDFSESVGVMFTAGISRVAAFACYLKKTSQFYSSESCIQI